MLRVSHVDIGDNIYDTAVGLRWGTFILTTVAGFHVEDRNVEALCTYDAQATVCVTKNENCIGLGLVEEFVRAVDYVATSSTKVVTYSIHIDLRILELEVVEEYPIEIVVIVLTRVGKDYIEVFAALANYSCKTDNLRACTNDDTELELTVFLPLHV